MEETRALIRRIRRMPAISLRDLGYFLAVAHSGHLSDSAATLGIPQPTLSRRIARLEEVLGAQLFERGGHQLRLNTRGEALIPAATAIIQQANLGFGQVHRLMDPERGTVRLDFMHSLGTWLVPELIRSYRSLHPQVEIQLHQGAAAHLIERVRAGLTDLALVGPKPDTELGWQQLRRQRLALALPEDHHLAHSTDPISLKEAAEEPFIGMLPGYGTRLLLDRLSAEAGFSPQLVFESMELTTVTGLVSAGLGVALLPLDDPYLAPTGIVLRPIDPPCYRELGLVWRRSEQEAPPVDMFRRFICA
ncbi:LysR family transcriptional regulator [Corynebacterium spheniscorum]|uniref:DNA-binding transcriptional regulator, LysR family n=1 Tax=Corynebacterium spheniscorum TaxID=185761 RepID=A0A1I2UTK6_9CORY|nr:LysR family transcriptional regulator [Corynebacterium spheniscorum]SFG79117.1 DNA-binding transcriptional regulator, LysR family [Corynebacterium spheniscorum]